jgi:hypothetical protein
LPYCRCPSLVHFTSLVVLRVPRAYSAYVRRTRRNRVFPSRPLPDVFAFFSLRPCPARLAFVCVRPCFPVSREPSTARPRAEHRESSTARPRAEHRESSTRSTSTRTRLRPGTELGPGPATSGTERHAVARTMRSYALFTFVPVFRAAVSASEPICGDPHAPARTGSSPYRHTRTARSNTRARLCVS